MNFIHNIIMAILLLCISYGCDYRALDQQAAILSGHTMGTTYTIKIYAPEKNIDHAMISTVINQHLDAINMQMSTYIETSAISLFNQSREKDWVEIPVEFYTVLKEALRINQLSDRAFDVTIGPIVNLWGFGPTTQSQRTPDEATLRETLKTVGSEYIELHEKPYAIRKTNPQLMLDLSAIAKGFAVDVIANYLNAMDINNYIIEIGGEIKARGVNPDNEIWRIGIEKPLDSQRGIQAVINLPDLAMATSGDYRNYFENNGIRYSHTIDPRTGKPIIHKLASVTVLHPKTMTADAMATALMVLGEKDGFSLALEENIAALFIIREQDRFIEIITPQFKRYLVNAD